MKRKIYNKLLEWKNNGGKSALLIQGARRVGKSYIAEEFGRNEYNTYILIDFSVAPEEVKELFRDYRHDISFVLNRLQVFYGVTLHERRSLVIMDEVQFCPHARAAIKQLVAHGRYDYIATGSLISIKQNVKDILIPSEELTIEMYPMDFEEFLWAKGDNLLYPYIQKCYEEKKPLGSSIHRKATQLFREYMAVGGMPQAVKALSAGEGFDEVERIKSSIINLYRADISKYANGQSIRVTAIFDEIPGQLQKHERKFTLSDISPNARMRTYSEAFFWLADARIINCCYNSTAPNIGLRLNEERTTLKCYMGDTGLLISMAFDEGGKDLHELYRKIIFGNLEVNEGMIMENMVAQMLTAAGHKLYFFSRNDSKDSSNTMEIDFMAAKSKVTSRHNIIPIEVKSGSRYTYSSIRKLQEKYSAYISTPIILHTKDLEQKNGILYLPLYMTQLI